MDVLLHRRGRSDQNCGRSHGEVNGERVGDGIEREARVIRNNPRGGPAADNRVQPLGGAPQQRLAAPNRQLINVICADRVDGIEVRTGTAQPQVAQVADKSLRIEARKYRVIGNVRDVVNRPRILIVEIELQVVRGPFAQRGDQAVIARRSPVADIGYRAGLIRQASVGQKKSGIRQQ